MSLCSVGSKGDLACGLRDCAIVRYGGNREIVVSIGGWLGGYSFEKGGSRGGASCGLAAWVKG